MFRSIFKAYSTSLLGIFSGLLTQLVFIRELAHMVSTDEFALYAFAFQIATYLNFLQLGLDFATSREIALKLGQDDTKGAYQSYLFIRRFNNKICIGGLLLVLLCVVLFYFGIGISQAFNSNMAAKLIGLFGVSIIINFLANPSIVALIGTNRQAVVNINNTLMNIATTIVAIGLLKGFHLGIYSMPLSLLALNLVNLYLLSTKAARYCKSWLVKQIAAGAPPGYNKNIIRFSVITTIGGFAWTIEATSDVFILNATGYLVLVGFYVLWWRFPQMFFDLATRLTTSALPSLNRAFGKSVDESKLIFNRLLLLVGGIGFVLFVCIATSLPAFINLWVGPQFFIDDLQITSFLIGMLVYSRTIGNAFGMYCITIGRVNYSTSLSWMQAGVKVIIAVILVKYLGLKGLFIASIAGSAVQVTGCGLLLIKNELLRRDVLVLLIIGYIGPLSLLLFSIEERITLFRFFYGASVTLLCAVAAWVLYIQVLSLDNKLGISISINMLLKPFKKK